MVFPHEWVSRVETRLCPLPAETHVELSVFNPLSFLPPWPWYQGEGQSWLRGGPGDGT